MAPPVLKKTAAPDSNGALPKEVLNPLAATQHFTARVYPPAPALAHAVERYWTLRWDLRGKPPFVSDVLPSPSVNLTFMREGARITGVATGTYAYELADQGAILGVTFLPGAFRPYWRASVHTLTNRAVPAAQVFAQIDAALNAAVLAAATDAAMIAAAEPLLVTVLTATDPNVQRIGAIMDAIGADPAPTVRAIAGLMAMSERSIQALFRSYVGVGLKWVLLRTRLQRAALLAVQHEAPDWAGIAHELGYADQAHFVNDFKKVIGMPPAQYAAMARASGTR